MTKAIALFFAFIAGAVAGGSVCYLYFDRQAKAEKAEEVASITAENHDICGFHHAALYQRANLYRQKFGHWPTNVQALVETHFLPEFSQVHLCPSQIADGGLITSYDHKWTFVDNNQKGAAGYFASSPYRFEFDGTNFTVRCTIDSSHNKE